MIFPEETRTKSMYFFTYWFLFQNNWDWALSDILKMFACGTRFSNLWLEGKSEVKTEAMV